MLGQDLYPKFSYSYSNTEAYGQDYYFPNTTKRGFSLEPVKTITDNEDFIPMSGQKNRLLEAFPSA